MRQPLPKTGQLQRSPCSPSSPCLGTSPGSSECHEDVLTCYRRVLTIETIDLPHEMQQVPLVLLY